MKPYIIILLLYNLQQNVTFDMHFMVLKKKVVYIHVYLCSSHTN